MKKNLGLVIALTLSVCGCSADTMEQTTKDTGNLEITTASETVSSNAIVLTIDGEEINKITYLLYKYTVTQSFVSMMYGQLWDSEVEGMTEEEFINEQVVETLRGVTAAKKYAVDHNLAVTDEDEIEIVEASQNFMGMMYEENIESIGLTEENLVEMMRDSFIYTKVLELVGEEFVIDEEDKQAYTEEMGYLIAMDYTMLDLDHTLVSGFENATEVVTQLESGVDFQELFQQYDISVIETESAQTSEMLIARGQFANTFGVEDDLVAGDIIGPVDIGEEHYFVFLVNEVDEPTGDDLQEIIDETYFEHVGYEFADGQMQSMIEGQEIEIVDEFVDALPSFLYY